MRIKDIYEDAVSEMRHIQAVAAHVTDLGRTFVRTDDSDNFRAQVFRILSLREAQLKAGVFEQKGVALLGPAGAEKSRIVEDVIREFGVLVEATGGRVFGSRIISVVGPGGASVKDTCRAILRELGYDILAYRDEDYLWQKVMDQMRINSIAALHLDEVKDSGRFITPHSMALNTKHFRNMMQDREWSVYLILSATPDAKEFINNDLTLTRGIKVIEMRDADVKTESSPLIGAILEMASKLHLDDQGFFQTRNSLVC